MVIFTIINNCVHRILALWLLKNMFYIVWTCEFINAFRLRYIRHIVMWSTSVSRVSEPFTNPLASLNSKVWNTHFRIHPGTCAYCFMNTVNLRCTPFCVLMHYSITIYSINSVSSVFALNIQKEKKMHFKYPDNAPYALKNQNVECGTASLQEWKWRGC